MKNVSKGILLELTATLLWSSSFVVTKGTTDNFPPMLLAGIRLLVGSVLIGIIFRKKFVKTNKELVLVMAISGFFYALGMILQNLGIKYTSAGRTAFITAAYCIFVPILETLIFKKKTTLKQIISAIVCMVGVGLIVLENGLQIDSGDLFTLIGSICFAVEITVFGNTVEKYDADLASFYILFFSGISALIASFFLETYPSSININTILSIAYLALPCTGIAMMLQGKAQTCVSPSLITLILGFEAVFAAIISAIVYGESFTTRSIFGCILVFASTFIVLINSKKKS